MSSAPKPSRKLSRRGLLAAGGGATVLAGLGATLGLSASAQAESAVPTSGRFDLTAPSNRLFWKKPLHNGTVLQCFAFDNAKGHLYTLQVTSGSEPAQGNLTMTKLDLTGKKLARMYLEGFGHGIAFGVQPMSSGEPMMWTEAVIGQGDRATKVCRFRFRDSATPITADDVELFTPIEGMRSASCSLDLDHNTIAVRYFKDGLDAMHVSLFDFDAFAAGDFSAPLADVSCAAAHPPGVTAQGYQHYGQHLYLYQGNAYYHDEGTAEANCAKTHPDGELDGNVKVSRINFADPDDHETHLTKAGYSLNFREPEGLGLLKLDGKPRLAMGFASGCSGKRLASIYYKDSDPI